MKLVLDFCGKLVYNIICIMLNVVAALPHQ